jgi:hypothetical protein
MWGGILYSCKGGLTWGGQRNGAPQAQVGSIDSEYAEVLSHTPPQSAYTLSKAFHALC